MRRTINECPEIMEKIQRQRPQVHPPAKSIFTLNTKNLTAFKEIAMQIKMICHCRVYAFGSRVNGNYTNESDYDIVVYCDNIYKSTINNFPFNHKVDIHFTNNQRNDLIEL